jgi:hypothetical protein
MASAYLRKAHEGAGNRKTFTISAWVKRAVIGGDHTIFSQGTPGGGYYSKLRIRTDDVLQYEDIPNAGNVNLKTNKLFRDTNAWYHIVVRVDTTQSTAADRVRIYVNGTQETSFSTANYPAQDNNQQANENSSMSVTVGGRTAVNDGYWDGQMAHVHYSDGQSYAPTTFGEFDSNGVWIPKTAPTVSYGVNGFFLKFDNDSNMGLDSSGQSHNLTTTGTIIQNKDTPTNNHPTINKLDRRTNDMTVTNTGNTGETNASVYTPGVMSLGADSGKWYWEVKVASKTGSSDWHMIGIMGRTRRDSNKYLGQVEDQYSYYGLNGYKYTDDSGTSYGNSYGVGDIIGVAMDLDNNKLYFHKNGTYQNSGVPTSGSTGTGAISINAASATRDGVYRPAICYFDGSTKATYQCNFGNGYFGTTKITSAGSNGNGSLFEYDVPTGYYALNTKNLKDQS